MKPLIYSTVVFKTVCIKKNYKTRRFFSLLCEVDTEFLIEQSIQDVQAQCRDSMTYGSASSDNTSKSTQGIYPQKDLHKLEENIVGKVRSEVNKVTTTVETRVQNAVMRLMEIIVTPRVELTMKAANTSPVWSFDDTVLELIMGEGFVKNRRPTNDRFKNISFMFSFK